MKQEVTFACMNAVMDAITAGKSFTAYDITTTVRGAGHWAEHGDVKKYVHDRMQSEIKSGLEYEKVFGKFVSYQPISDDDGDADDVDPTPTMADLMGDSDDDEDTLTMADLMGDD